MLFLQEICSKPGMNPLRRAGFADGGSKNLQQKNSKHSARRRSDPSHPMI
ncbi:MAG: hypothetical protein AB7H71_06365 [Alphaproteobacteria bacterium]